MNVTHTMAEPLETRPEPGEVLFELAGPRDGWGNCFFYVMWLAECVTGCDACHGQGCGAETVLGQVFHTDPVALAVKDRRRGWQVRVTGVDADQVAADIDRLDPGGDERMTR